MQAITIGNNTYNLVTLPSSPGAAEMSLCMSDAIAVVQSPYVPAQMQAQAWPGADAWDGAVILPPLSNDQAAEWEGFLAELRGQLNVFQLGDPRRQQPRGNAQGSAPKMSGTDIATATQITTTGWKANNFRVLLRGDLFQVGYHLYRTCEQVNADASGHATISIWPSLRESSAAGAPLVLASPVGVWRLADNRRESQFSPMRLTTMSFKILEVR
jgi:hypothetical protein